VQPRDPGGVAAQQLRGEVAQRADHDRLDQVHLPEQVVLARGDLVRVRVAVARRAAFEHVGHKHIFPVHCELTEQRVEQLPRLSDERETHPVLVGPRRLADEHQVGVRVPGTEHDRRAGLVERARDALTRLLVDGLQQLAPVCGAPHRPDPSR